MADEPLSAERLTPERVANARTMAQWQVEHGHIAGQYAADFVLLLLTEYAAASDLIVRLTEYAEASTYYQPSDLIEEARAWVDSHTE